VRVAGKTMRSLVDMCHKHFTELSWYKALYNFSDNTQECPKIFLSQQIVSLGPEMMKMLL